MSVSIIIGYAMATYLPLSVPFQHSLSLMYAIWCGFTPHISSGSSNRRDWRSLKHSKSFLTAASMLLLMAISTFVMFMYCKVLSRCLRDSSSLSLTEQLLSDVIWRGYRGGRKESVKGKRKEEREGGIKAEW